MRIRARFAKLGKVRWTSHRDVARMWERALRRTQLPVAWTGGFSPRPKLSFGLALPTGAESVAEYLDLEVAGGHDVDLAGLPGRLSAALPVGIDVQALAVVDDRADSLQQVVTSCSWELELPSVAPEEAERLVAATLAASELIVTRERKGRQVTDDLRPAIRTLAVSLPADDGVLLEAELATLSRGLRPTELVAALGPHLELAGVRRMAQWIERDGAKEEPLALAATDAPHALGRAS